MSSIKFNKTSGPINLADAISRLTGDAGMDARQLDRIIQIPGFDTFGTATLTEFVQIGSDKFCPDRIIAIDLVGPVGPPPKLGPITPDMFWMNYGSDGRQVGLHYGGDIIVSTITSESVTIPRRPSWRLVREMFRHEWTKLAVNGMEIKSIVKASYRRSPVGEHGVTRFDSEFDTGYKNIAKQLIRVDGRHKATNHMSLTVDSMVHEMTLDLEQKLKPVMTSQVLAQMFERLQSVKHVMSQ